MCRPTTHTPNSAPNRNPQRESAGKSARTCVKLCGFDFYCNAAHFGAVFSFSVCLSCPGFHCFIGPLRGAYPCPKSKSSRKYKQVTGPLRSDEHACECGCNLVMPRCPNELLPGISINGTCHPRLHFPLLASHISFLASRFCAPRGHHFHRCTPNEAISSGSNPYSTRLRRSAWHFWVVNRSREISVHW